MCAGHYRRFSLGKPLDAPMVTPRRYKGKKCSVKLCTSKVHAKGYCTFHYNRSWRGTTPVDAPRNFLGEWSDWYINSNGYMERSRTVPTKKGRGFKERQLEHRFMMEKVLGRSLVKGENVHHKNGDRTDNRPSNLELWNTKQPSGQRVEDKLMYAKEMFELYAPTGTLWEK